MKILIADDDDISRLALQTRLTKMGHEITAAADGTEAWQKLEAEHSLRLAILDWMMPGMDGPELCRRVRKAGWERYVYLILLTARDGRDDRLRGLGAGADDFLTKPLDAAELVVRLQIADRLLAVHEELARRNAQLVELATTDPLTGVKNRRRFWEDLNLHFALTLRGGPPLSLAMFDIDYFKLYNDEFGHSSGDEALRNVAELLCRGVRPHDVVSRYGGDEFAVLLPAADEESAIKLAERVKSSIADWPWPLHRVTVSCGVATTGPEVTTADGLRDLADQALYFAKRAGRNQVRHYRHNAPCAALTGRETGPFQA